MLLYHPSGNSFYDFDEVYRYIMHSSDGTSTEIETDCELHQGQIVIFHGMADYMMMVMKIWTDGNGVKHLYYDSAEGLVARARERYT